ncbi:hypothetical protein [Dactylosporangium sp. CA-233914]|uniref:hypothetical protein n=1 Tax=Dactylosporangium sp. CA-233914 TaxID=3239934 RepID=UPI003D8BEF6D
MIERLTQRWRREVAEQEAAVAAGTLSAEEAYASRAWPADFTDGVDAALAAFERDVAGLGTDPADEVVWAAVERVVCALNVVDETFEGHIDTITREELCEYIDDVVTDAGVDVEALTARRGCEPHELTDEWRDW